MALFLKGSAEFLASWESLVNSLAVVFDRMPKYAWIMKQVRLFLVDDKQQIYVRISNNRCKHHLVRARYET